MESNDFQDLLDKLKKTKFSDEKIACLQNLPGDSNLNGAQIAKILGLFHFNDLQCDAVTALESHVKNLSVEEMRLVIDAGEFSESKLVILDALLKFVDQHAKPEVFANLLSCFDFPTDKERAKSVMRKHQAAA